MTQINSHMKLLTVSFIALSMSFSVHSDTAHLVSVDGGFRTTHGLSYTISSDQMVATKPNHRTDQFGDNPYEISLGASNYEAKPPSDWPDQSFRSDGAVCIDVPASEIEGEHDLEWLQDNGFEPSGSLAYAQYFATTPDFNDEIVITLLAPVSSCGPHIDPATALARLKAGLVITLIE